MDSVLSEVEARWASLSRAKRAEFCRALRRRGLSYGEIQQLIPVPKGTLAGWCRDIHLTDEQRAAIRRRTGPVKGQPRDTQARRRAEIAEIQAAARRQVPSLVTDPFWVAGVVLYWAEGDKTHRVFAVCNTDPALLRIFIGWVNAYHIPDPRLVLSLHLHEGDDEATSKAYWQRQLGLPEAEFWKTYIKPAGTGHRKKTIANGVCRVVVRNGTDAWLRTLAWIDALADLPWEAPTPQLLSSRLGR